LLQFLKLSSYRVESRDVYGERLYETQRQHLSSRYSGHLSTAHAGCTNINSRSGTTKAYPSADGYAVTDSYPGSRGVKAAGVDPRTSSVPVVSVDFSLSECPDKPVLPISSTLNSGCKNDEFGFLVLGCSHEPKPGYVYDDGNAFSFIIP
jgi:hypothetical protein